VVAVSFLFTEETDLGIYARSVDRLARLAPDLQLLLPSHNVPVADPKYLRLLKDAVARVQSGTAKPAFNGGRREYMFDGFSLLLAPQKQ
jgi:hypothetical protein